MAFVVVFSLASNFHLCEKVKADRYSCIRSTQDSLEQISAHSVMRREISPVINSDLEILRQGVLISYRDIKDKVLEIKIMPQSPGGMFPKKISYSFYCF